MKTLLPLLLLAVSLHLQAQDSSSQYFIYFDLGAHDIRPKEQTRLDSLLKKNNAIQHIQLAGHTDNKGSQTYNLALSKRRAQAVSRYLQNGGIAEDQISTSFHGEERPTVPNISEQDRQGNRRVEMIIYWSPKIHHPQQPTATKSDKNKSTELTPAAQNAQQAIEETSTSSPATGNNTLKDTSHLEGDTILIIDEVQIVVARQEYEKLKDCLKINVINSGEEALAEQITTMTVDNQLLVSCGMIDIQLAPPCKGCFDQPIRIRFPRANSNSECQHCKRALMYDVGRDGRWAFLGMDRGLKKVRIDGKNYYEMLIRCPSRKNCDCPVEFKKVKFKIPQKYKLLALNVFYNCPIANYEFKVKNNQAEGQLSCELLSAEAFVYAKLQRKDGKTLVINKIPLKTLKHTVWRRCKKSRKKNKLLIFKSWQDILHSKYRLSRKDIVEYAVEAPAASN